MPASNHEPKRIPVQGYACDGGYDTDRDYRPFKHSSTGRRNWRRKSSKYQRIADKNDVRQRMAEAQP